MNDMKIKNAFGSLPRIIDYKSVGLRQFGKLDIPDIAVFDFEVFLDPHEYKAIATIFFNSEVIYETECIMTQNIILNIGLKIMEMFKE